jgi:hypothetical protein
MKKSVTAYLIILLISLSVTYVSFARLNSDSLGGQVDNSLAAPMKADGLGPLSQRIVGHRSRGLDESLQAGTIYEVKNTNDSGADSLRDAITQANAHVGADTIVFNIPGPGPFKIAPLTALPQITSPNNRRVYTTGFRC